MWKAAAAAVAVVWISWGWRSFAVVVGTGAAVIVGTLVVKQEEMLYQNKAFPQYMTPDQNPRGYRSPNERGMLYEDIWLTTTSQRRVHAWHIHPTMESRPTILFFQGNAGNVGFRLDFFTVLVKRLQCHVFAVSYAGYGWSEGTPSEEALLEDALAAHQHLAAVGSPIIAFGRSLGGAVAMKLASQCHVDAIIVENTFTSIPDLASTLFPLLAPLRHVLVRLAWDTWSRLHQVTCPVLVVTGDADGIVPTEHSHRIAAALGERATLAVFPGGTHNDTWRCEGYVDRLAAFIASHVK